MKCMLLILVDCLRADHVSAYGYNRPTTPTIDKLAKEGWLWERAYSTCSWTKPSVASILSGRYPSEHGLFRGVKRSRTNDVATTDALSDSIPTLAERLSDMGWKCGAFLNNAQLGEYSNLHRGFGVYEPGCGRADRILDAFERWLAGVEGRAFAYLHFLEAHWPYKPRRRHVALFGGDRDQNRFRDYGGRDYAALRRGLKRGDIALDAEDVAEMVQMYDGAIRRVDGKIKRVLRILNDRTPAGDTAVFISADHGEELLDHGQIGHGHDLHEELTHVPLVARLPARGKGIRRIVPVSLKDLPATMLNLAEGSCPADGADLCAADSDSPPVFAELLAGRRYLQSVWLDEWKMLRSFRLDGERPTKESRGVPAQEVNQLKPTYITLYDLASDPSERKDRAGEPEAASALARCAAELDRWTSQIADGEVHLGSLDVEIDARVVKRLRDLGYVE